MINRRVMIGGIALIAAGAMVVPRVSAQGLRYPNVSRIRRAWNSFNPLARAWNKAMASAAASLSAFPPGKVVNMTEQAKRVVWYKEAREAGVKQVEALDEMIDEEQLDPDVA